MSDQDEFVAIPQVGKNHGLTGYFQQVIANLNEYSINGLIVSLEVGGAYIPNHSRVLLYFSTADPDNAGKSLTFTCTTKFEVADSPKYATEYEIKNYYGELSFLKGSANSTLAELNKADMVVDGPWSTDAEPLSEMEKFEKTHKFGSDS